MTVEQKYKWKPDHLTLVYAERRENGKETNSSLVYLGRLEIEMQFHL